MPTKKKDAKPKVKNEATVEETTVESTPVEKPETAEVIACEGNEPVVVDPEAAEEKAKEEKPVAGKGKGKAKGANKGEEWFEKTGKKLLKKEHGKRNILLRAAKAAGKTPADVSRALAKGFDSFEELVVSLFD